MTALRLGAVAALVVPGLVLMAGLCRTSSRGDAAAERALRERAS